MSHVGVDLDEIRRAHRSRPAEVEVTPSVPISATYC